MQSLNVPCTLHRSLLSTNAIENLVSQDHSTSYGVRGVFEPETDQATYWMSCALLEVEKGFRRISGYEDMPKLVAALERETEG